MELKEKDQKYIWHPYSRPGVACEIIVKGTGACLFDTEGKKYIDAISSWWVTIHGHSHPYIAKKVSEQLFELDQVIFAGYSHPQAIRLAERVLEFTGSAHQKVFFSDNGSTSVEVALKIAIQYWKNTGNKKRAKVIALKGSYHGDTFGAMSVSERGLFTNSFSEFLFDIVFVDPFSENSREDFLNYVNMDDVICFIYEPLVQGAAGMLMYEQSLLEDFLNLCRDHKVITIADEVMTGFFRTGFPLASHCIEQKPDLYCLSKGLTGGTMPLGITTVSGEIMEAFYLPGSDKLFYHGHSFTGSPIACSAANASLDLIEEPLFKELTKNLSGRLSSFAGQLSNNSNVVNLRVKGNILAFNLNFMEDDYINNSREAIIEFFFKRGIIIRPLGNTLYFMPPYCIKNDELDILFKVTLEFLNYSTHKTQHTK